MLQAVGQRLEKSESGRALSEKARALPAVTVARIGGNEFGILIPAALGISEATSLARLALEALADAFTVDGRELYVSGSIGIAFGPGDGDDVETLLSHAGVALSHARQEGGSGFRFYDRSLDAESVERLGLESQLRRAIERDELRLFYQPKVDLRSGRIVGAEGLIRWQHPTLGLLPPARFLPIAEETGLIVEMGAWALRTVARQCGAWEREGVGPLRISVNTVSRQFHSGGLVELIRDLIREGGFDPRLLVLELTEGTIMDNPQETASILQEIKALGPQISIDDFGTGYSSLSYLKRFPLDELKIDRSFVCGVPGGADDAAITTAIFGLARTLGLRVVAEGVETPEQLAFLRQIGCDEYQGYLRSRPIPVSEWPALLASEPGPA